MSVAVTVHQTLQTSHDTGKYVAVETCVFPDTASLREIMNWATGNDRRVEWNDLVFTPAPEANRPDPICPKCGSYRVVHPLPDCPAEFRSLSSCGHTFRATKNGTDYYCNTCGQPILSESSEAKR